MQAGEGKPDLVIAEAVANIRAWLFVKAQERLLKKTAEPLLGPEGSFPHKIWGDVKKLPPEEVDYVEEYAILLEKAVDTGKLGLP